MSLSRPIIILGAARSGTTLLAEHLLGEHPEVVYWGEPSFVWRYKNASQQTDVLSADEATPEIKSYIRTQFENRLREGDGSRFMEKTPANCLRMPFVLEVLPDARVVHLIRDGRDVALSASREWQGGGEEALDSRSLRQANRVVRVWRTFWRELQLQDRVNDLQSFLELFSYRHRLVEFLKRQALPGAESVWGPRVPGLEEFRQNFSLLETCAIQWDLCVRHARSGCAVLPDEQYLEIHYETLLTEPRETLVEIFDFVDLSTDDAVVEDIASAIVPRTVPSWPSQMDPSSLRAVESIIASTLEQFGYPVSIADNDLKTHEK